jgi:uncharacterized protein with gpF-like domain
MHISAAQPPLNAIDSSEHFDAAIDAIQKRSPMPKDEWERLSSLERESAFTVAHVTQADVLQDVLDSLESAVTHGTDFEQFKDDCYLQLLESWGGEIPGRMETVFRSNLMTSYNEGRYSILSSPTVKEARPVWRLDAVMDDRICDECEDLAGTTLPADDPFWDTHYPPFHHNDRCVVTALSQDEADDAGGVDDEGPDVELDDDFGDAPSKEGENWNFDLSRFDPELREILEAKLAESQDDS